MATLFRMLHGGVSRKVYVFSSVEYALYWLKSKITEEEAERILSQLTPLKV